VRGSAVPETLGDGDGAWEFSGCLLAAHILRGDIGRVLMERNRLVRTRQVDDTVTMQEERMRDQEREAVPKGNKA
jgi:hypothetical protein